ncbi:MAG: TetR/AcrR family transcriptional regulator [Eggerthellaceae bacterium]
MREDGMAMTRTVKAPEERKCEILDAAMELFIERGYESTSLRDIAKHMGITPGLVYHYFDSKQKLFDEAMTLYVEECTAEYVRVLRSTDLDFRQKVDALFSSVTDEESLRYHDFFHAQGNEAASPARFALADICVPICSALPMQRGRGSRWSILICS